MKLQELRIGNFFEIQSYYEEASRIKTITEIGKKQVYIDGNWIELDELIPIYVTEEILLNSGFTQFTWLKDSLVFECKWFKCSLRDDGVHLFCENLKILKPVQYLHELQNLHFDLSGEELKTNFNSINSIKTEIA